MNQISGAVKGSQGSTQAAVYIYLQFVSDMWLTVQHSSQHIGVSL
jgi:hypothetical protein